MRGGKSARREARLMVNEKIEEAVRAGASIMAGASGDEIVRRYRRRVAANEKRLTRSSSGFLMPKRRRRRPK
jgi:ketosteroid isomerase-like protein